MDVKETKFMQDLKAYLPHLHALDAYTKTEERFMDVIDLMKLMRDKDLSGAIEIRYSNGKIDRVKQESIIYKVR